MISTLLGAVLTVSHTDSINTVHLKWYIFLVINSYIFDVAATVLRSSESSCSLPLLCHYYSVCVDPHGEQLVE